MKTISGNTYMIDESILSSVGAGRKTIIDKFLNDTLRANQYTLNSDMSISLTSKKVLFSNRIDIPTWIRDCDEVEFVECGMSELKLPNNAKCVIIDDCSKLKTLSCEDGSKIEELIIKNCDNITDISTLSRIEIKKVRIHGCGISSLQGLENVLRAISIKSCKKLRDYDLVNKNNPIIKITGCPIRVFSKPVFAEDITLNNLKNSSILEIKIGATTDLRIEECDSLEDLKISGSKLSTLVVDNCNKLKKIETVDCISSASFVDLPAIEEYVLPVITGACVFENVKTVPEVQCKRKLVRK